MTDELTALLDTLEEQFEKAHIGTYTPPKPRVIRKPKNGAKSFEEALRNVRHLAGRHNAPDYETPLTRPRVANTPDLTNGWRSNQYVRWILAGKPKPDMRFLWFEGTYLWRTPGKGNNFLGLGGVHEYHKALEARDQKAKELGINLDDYPLATV